MVTGREFRIFHSAITCIFEQVLVVVSWCCIPQILLQVEDVEFYRLN